MEQEFTFEDNHHNNKQKGSVLKFLWNSDTKEFLGRDGASWAKVSLFYAVFYTCLGSFFVGMLAVFMYQMPRNVPTYYGKSSTMNMRGLNPGLGFRPQIDVEDHLIYYNPTVNDNPSNGYSKYVKNLKNFLDAKYKPTDDSSSFNYIKSFEDTDCTFEKNFGFDKPGKACVLLKLNKIISWKPAGNNVTIKCSGEFSADKDNFRGATYYSPDKITTKESGSLDEKYFPYMNQPSYRAPFVFAQFDIPANTLVNIECRAYDLDNIDNTDRLNRRGMTKFSLYVEAPVTNN